MRDDIAQHVEIAASIETVWRLVSEPGWWINDGRLGHHRVERIGDECIVHDPNLGAFSVGIVALEPPHRAVFTWHPGGDDVPRTTVEFTLEQATDAVIVTVRESGFSAFAPDAHERNFGANEAGWREELDLLRAATEAAHRAVDR
ncbi:SRPBCC domain-containing protein [Microbacterium gorillae]|uniref:SRPBCC domain-containing protein n=1 Tax=Microbacterium gorillae TaxID=1231063 RepID=UPI00058F0DFE|nr:SRPBCC domain-containing protein [Microbacterium gorillae]